MNRQRVMLGEPPDDLTEFPTTIHDDSFFRASRRTPWWFCRDGRCRFDLLVLTEPRWGTLYAGTDEVTGVIEAIGPELVGRSVAIAHLARLTVWELAYDRPLRLADLCAPRAMSFGVTNELASIVPYDLPIRWAGAFFDHDLDGVLYRTRFTTATGPTGLALFDDAGAHDDWEAALLCTADDPIVLTALEAIGLEVLRTAPHSSEFTIVD